MSKRLKTTPFARFFVAMFFIAPLAYIGAGYMNGQDGVENLKNLFGGAKEKTEMVEESPTTTTTTTHSNSNSEESSTLTLEQLQETLAYKNQEIKRLREENEVLRGQNIKLELQLTEKETLQETGEKQ